MPESPQHPAQHRRRRPHFDYRARSHASAHANGDALPPATIPEHPLIPRNAGDLITTDADLGQFIEQARVAGRFAYDSEFIGELSYHPKLCLIQVATAERVALIDSLADIDLGPFWQLLADPAVEKIVHAGQQDLEPVHRLSGHTAANIFDTQIAAGFIGLPYPVGLSKLVREMTGVTLGKGCTFTHWDQRPLSNVQLRYAADDVRYLPALRDAIGQKLDQLHHAAWAAEECNAMCDPSLYELDPSRDYLRLRGASALSPRGVAVLRELVIWREGAAQRHDSPPRAYLKDEILMELARRPVTTIAGLGQVRGLPRPVEATEGTSLVEAVQRGLAIPEPECPTIEQTEESPSDRFATDALWAAVQTWCHGRLIDPNLATSRQEVARFARGTRRGNGENDTRLLRGWRRELLGNLFAKLLRTGGSLRIDWADGTMRSQITGD